MITGIGAGYKKLVKSKKFDVHPVLELAAAMVDGFIIELAVDESIKWVHIIYIELSIATGESKWTSYKTGKRL